MNFLCRLCKIEKPLTDFPWMEKGTRRASRCKECQKTLSKKHYRENKEPYTQRAKIKREQYLIDTYPKLYQYLLEHPCVQCGETEPMFLEFDHLDPLTKRCGVGSMITSKIRWPGILEEIKKCQVLCVKCHRFKTNKTQNTYKYKRYLEKNNPL